MAIVKMSKFNIVLFEESRRELIKSLQEFDYVHFNNLSQTLDDDYGDALKRFDSSEEINELNDKLNDIDWAINKIEGHKEKKSFIENLKEGIEKMSIMEIKDKGEKIDLENILVDVHRIIDTIENSEDRINELANGKNIMYKTGSIPRKNVDILLKYIKGLKHTNIELLNEDGRNQYFNLITDNTELSGVDSKLYDLGYKNIDNVLRKYNLSEMEISSLKDPKDQDEITNRFSKILRDKRDLALSELDEKGNEYYEALKVSYEYDSNKKKLLEQDEKFLNLRSLSFIEGYIPESKEKEFKNIIDNKLGEDYALDLEKAKKDDPNVPIILKNNKLVEPFESIVKTYSMPKYSEVDPTPTVMPWYSIFFGFMLGDFGYGLLLFILTTVALKVFNLKKSTKNFLKFFQILSIPTMVAGLIYGSFLGGLIPIPGLIDTDTDYMFMIVASVGIGLVQLLFGLGVKTYMYIRDGKKKDVIYDVVSWYLVLIGALLIALTMFMGFDVLFQKVGLAMFILGLVIVLLFSARDENGKFARFAWGAYNVYGVTSYLGDLVSYARIAALALSGAYIGYAVNLIASMLMGGGIIGIPFAVIVLLVFHAFNLFLSGLSAYVHSMRLIYVEYYGQFYEGGGVPFEKLQTEGKYIELLNKEI